MYSDIHFICNQDFEETTSTMENIVQTPTTPPSTPCKSIKSIKKKLENIKEEKRRVELRDHPIYIGNRKYIKLSTYKKKPYVNIREYITTAQGKLYPTKKGILLKPEEWKQLHTIVKQVNQRLKSV